MMSKVLDGLIPGERLLDIGCGYGELLHIINEQDTANKVSYIGLDACTPMIEEARKLFPGFRFLDSPFETFVSKERIHHIFCCGVFTKKLDASDEEMYELLKTLFSKASDFDGRTITLNMMSPFCDNRPAELFFPEFERIESIVRDQWGYKVKAFSFSSEYLQYEMLVHIKI